MTRLDNVSSNVSFDKRDNAKDNYKYDCTKQHLLTQTDTSDISNSAFLRDDQQILEASSSPILIIDDYSFKNNVYQRKCNNIESNAHVNFKTFKKYSSNAFHHTGETKNNVTQKTINIISDETSPVFQTGTTKFVNKDNPHYRKYDVDDANFNKPNNNNKHMVHAFPSDDEAPYDLYQTTKVEHHTSDYIETGQFTSSDESCSYKRPFYTAGARKWFPG